MSLKSVSHYEIVKKLGEGGMGEVFLARDTRLDRQVALKFLPSHLTNDPKARERLLREARAASRLSHPNILTVHEVGEDESGRIFIAMQYVDGRSLDEIVADGPLPVDQVVSLAVQIGAGLARAHAAGIVHRDIKPQNIIVDGDGRGTILDFGLAKVVDASRLTQSGAMIGTMAYMSPEQARGDLADQRSDVFSLGAVLYEMVTGRRAFSPDNAAAVIYAIINETPPAPSQINPACPSALERIIGRALVKDPNERYQSVGEMLADLRPLIHSSNPAISDPALMAARAGAADPNRPSWPSGPVTVPDIGRRWLRMGLAAAVFFILLLSAALFSPLKLSMFRSQQALADKNTLAIMQFEQVSALGNQDRTGQMIASLLITDLSESRFMNVISRQCMLDIARQLGVNDLGELDASMSGRVADAANARWILTGEVLQIEPQIILTSQISDAKSGTILASQRINGDTGDNIFNVVDRLARVIKNDLSLPDAAGGEADRAIADVTTHSPEAYGAFLRGMDQFDQLDYAAAIESFTEAVRIDSTFASAWSQLARSYRSRRMYDQQRWAIAHAMNFIERVTPMERLYIESAEAWADGDYPRAIELLKTIALRYPNETEALMYLGTVYIAKNQYDEAILWYDKMLAIDSTKKIAYNQLAYCYHYKGEHQKSLTAINRYIALAPDEANPYDSRGDFLAADGDAGAAIESYRAALERNPGFYHSAAKLGFMQIYSENYAAADSAFRRLFDHKLSDVRADGRLYRTFISMHQGRLGEALRMLDAGLASDRLENASNQPMSTKHMYKLMIYSKREEFDHALAELQSIRDLADSFEPHNRAFVRADHIMLLAKSGRLAAARDSLEALDLSVRGDTANNTMIVDALAWAKGWVAFGLEDYNSAAEHFAHPARRSMMFSARFYYALALFHAGRLGESVDEWREMLESHDEYRAQNPINSVEVHYWLGRAYEASGWTVQAQDQYRTFTRIWKTADPGLTAFADAKARLRQLAQIH